MKEKLSFYISRIAFILYCIIMLWLLFGQRITWVDYSDYVNSLAHNINLIPFRTISEYLLFPQDHLRHAFINLAGNIITFIPLGFFLPYFWKKFNFFTKHLLCSLLIILFIELFQFFTLLGSFDIDDLLLNIIGTAIGFFILKLIKFNKTDSK